MTVTIEAIVQRWTNPNARPLFKGNLISEDGCCCAQGDVLRCSGWTDDHLRSITQENADKEVSKILGISRGHAVLLRIVNDRADGCPQYVLTNPEKVLGPNAKVVLAFFRHFDTLDHDGWIKVAAARAAAGAAARDAARAAAWAAAGAAAWDAAGDAAGAAAGDAAWECVGISEISDPFFLRFFFSDVSAWLASVK